jgi:hypothetical protein
MDLRSSRLEALHAPGMHPDIDTIDRKCGPSPIDNRNARRRDPLRPHASHGRRASGRRAQQAECREFHGEAFQPNRLDPHQSAPAADES